MADVANEPSLHFSGSLAQFNPAIVQRHSSTQLPNSHSNLNTHGQVEANINLPVLEPQEPSSRNNVTNEAHNANNIIQEQQQPQYTPPSSPINFGMSTQLNAPNTARQLSQATMHSDGLKLDHQFPRRSSMPGQLYLFNLYSIMSICYPILHLHHSFPLQTLLYLNQSIHQPHKRSISHNTLSP